MNAPARRYTLVAAYAMHTIAGLAAVTAPSPTVEGSSGRAFATLWAVFLIVGGALSLYGAARHRWLPEFVGLPALVAVWLVYSIASMAYVVQGQTDRIAGAAALAGVALALSYRWQIVNQDRLAARRVGERHGSWPWTRQQ